VAGAVAWQAVEHPTGIGQKRDRLHDDSYRRWTGVLGQQRLWISEVKTSLIEQAPSGIRCRQTHRLKDEPHFKNGFDSASFSASRPPVGKHSGSGGSVHRCVVLPQKCGWSEPIPTAACSFPFDMYVQQKPKIRGLIAGYLQSSLFIDIYFHIFKRHG
jgi:hypothetical protein